MVYRKTSIKGDTFYEAMQKSLLLEVEKFMLSPGVVYLGSHDWRYLIAGYFRGTKFSRIAQTLNISWILFSRIEVHLTTTLQ